MFCILHIESAELGALPQELLRSSAVAFDFVDRDWPHMRERRKRVRDELGLSDVTIPRYRWQLNSDGFVDTDDIHDHLAWIFSQVNTNHSFSQTLGVGFKYWFSVFWKGNGTGGGPLITLQTIDLLSRHKAELAIGFYVF
jgi:hypothetical protein